MNHASFMQARASAFPSRALDELIARLIRGRPTGAPGPATELRAAMNKLSGANAERLMPRVRECLASDPELAGPVLGYAAANAGVAALLVQAVDPVGTSARAFLEELEAGLGRAPAELCLPANAEEDYDTFCATLARKAGLVGSCRVARLLHDRGAQPLTGLAAAAERGVLTRGNAFAAEVMLQCLAELGCAGVELRRRIAGDASLPFKLRFLAERGGVPS